MIIVTASGAAGTNVTDPARGADRGRRRSTVEVMFNGLLFFPITPYRGDGEVDLDELAAHIERGVDAGAGGVFVACGTGEFSALEPGEYAEVVRAAVDGHRRPGARSSPARAARCGPRGGSPTSPPTRAPTGCCCCRRT